MDARKLSRRRLRRRHAAQDKERCWSSLPGDLAGVVLRRLPSHVDRVRFGAVCREWRSAAQHDPVLPPQFPWIVLPDRTFYSLPGSAFQPLPPINLGGHRRTRAQSFCGEWLVFQRHDGAMTLVSPFSTITTMVLPSLPSMRKLVVCRGNNLVAAIAVENGHPRMFLCQPGAASWALVASGGQQLTIVKAIIFYRGKLYVLGCNHGLFSLCIDQSTADPFVSRVDRAIKNLGRLKPPDCYLVESGGALLVIQRVVAKPLWPLLSGLDTEMSTKFNVFVVNFEKSRWKIASSIGDDRTLFLGRWCSRSVHIPDKYTTYMGNRIFFLPHRHDEDFYLGKERFYCSSINMNAQRSESFMNTLVCPLAGFQLASWLFPQTQS